MTTHPILDIVPVELDELAIRSLRSMPDAEAAEILDGRLRYLEGQYKRNFVEKGFIALEMEERELFRQLIDPNTGSPFASFERWAVTAAPHSRSDVFEAKRRVKELRDIPREQLLNIPRKNLGILNLLSTSVRAEPAIIEAAQTKSRKDFIAQVQATHPDQHLESDTAIHLNTTESAKDTIETAILMAMALEDCRTREEAIEAIAVAYVQENQMLYDAKLADLEAE